MNYRVVKNPPLPEIIYQRLAELIEKGEWQVGEKLSSEVALAKQLQVSRTALREALQKLEMAGYIQRKHGVGTFVSSNAPLLTAGLERLESITEFIKSKGREPGTRESQIRTKMASESIAQHLNIKTGEKTIRFERVRTADYQPFSYDFAIISAEIFGDTFSTNEIHEYESIFDYLENKHNLALSHSYCNIFAENASETIAKKLEINPMEALQVLEQIYYTKDSKPVFYGKSYIRNDILGFHLIRRR